MSVRGFTVILKYLKRQLSVQKSRVFFFFLLFTYVLFFQMSWFLTLCRDELRQPAKEANLRHFYLKFCLFSSLPRVQWEVECIICWLINKQFDTIHKQLKMLQQCAVQSHTPSSLFFWRWPQFIHPPYWGSQLLPTPKRPIHEYHILLLGGADPHTYFLKLSCKQFLYAAGYSPKRRGRRRK